MSKELTLDEILFHLYDRGATHQYRGDVLTKNDGDFKDAKAQLTKYIEGEKKQAQSQLLERLRDWNSPGGIVLTDQEIDRRLSELQDKETL